MMMRRAHRDADDMGDKSDFLRPLIIRYQEQLWLAVVLRSNTVKYIPAAQYSKAPDSLVSGVSQSQHYNHPRACCACEDLLEGYF